MPELQDKENPVGSDHPSQPSQKDYSSPASRFADYYTIAFNKIMFSGPLRWMIFLGTIAFFLERLGVSRTIMVSAVSGYIVCYFLGVWKKWYKEEHRE